MKILYDHQAFSMQKYGGISRYFFEVIRGVQKKQGFEIHLPIVLSANSYLKDLNTIQYRQLEYIAKGFNWLVAYINRYHTVQKFTDSSIPFDVFHPTYYDPYFLPYLSGKPYVLTIYDMIHEIFPDYFSPSSKTSEKKKRLAQAASLIIAISENTKKDIIKIFGIKADKIRVIYLGVSPFSPVRDMNISIPGNFLLFVGQRYEYKNFLTLAESIRKILIRNNLFLICFGGGSFTRKEMMTLRELDIADRVIFLSGNDQVLAYLYRSAIAYICPSRYEGFGIPVLEAMSCGCPVVSSNVSSLMEVGGDAASYFVPHDKDSMEEAVDRIVSDTSYRQALIERGFVQARKFTWEKTAAETSHVYKEALATNGSSGP
ncbi:MAG: glycosyltransferase family 4 protein [Deltaproteobacteria bacterium]|nr:glycosyltransferase family 4 protein [Deltaproteobacteria bacterium]